MSFRRPFADARPQRGARVAPRMAAQGARGGRWFVLLAVLLALCCQSFVVQTHLHFDARVGPVGSGERVATPAATGSIGRQAPLDRPANCPICDELAMAGHYLSPGPILFVPAWPPAVALVAPLPRGFACWVRSHRWNSRAPPERSRS